MNEARNNVLDRERSTEFPRIDARQPTGQAPTIAGRWLVPPMWLAIGVVASVTTPQPVAEPPLLQAVIGEVLGLAALVAIVGLVVAAVTARPSLPLWSYGLGVVGLIGLATCQLFGHPVFSSAWGLSQVALVSAGLVVTGHMASRSSA